MYAIAQHTKQSEANERVSEHIKITEEQRDTKGTPRTSRNTRRTPGGLQNPPHVSGFRVQKFRVQPAATVYDASYLH
eukprot:1004167-Pyramimonas_sp.AAC.1